MMANQAGSKWCMGCSRKPSSTTAVTYPVHNVSRNGGRDSAAQC
jgi:hypothetical protein